MNDQELLRYSRHILLDEIGVEGQEKFKAAHIVLIGAGGLGSACAPYLAASGIGKITLVDHDAVELTNLQRQIMHTTKRIGQKKVTSAQTMLHELNPNITIEAVAEKADQQLLTKLLPTASLVIDCTDNFETRQLINALCVEYRKPLVSGAAVMFDGQVSVFDLSQHTSACYACVFPPTEKFEEVKCSSMGVLAPLLGMIGSLQAAQALQLLAGYGKNLDGRLLLWNAKTNSLDEIKTRKSANCPVCSKAH